MMLRMRRSRIILALSVFAIFLLYHFKSIPQRWQSHSPYAPQPPSGDRFVEPGPAQGNRPEDVQAEAQQHGVLASGALVKTTGTAEQDKQTTTVDDYGYGKDKQTTALEDSGLVFDTHEPPKAPAPTKAPANTEVAHAEHAAVADKQPGHGQPQHQKQQQHHTTKTVVIVKTKPPQESMLHWTKVPEHFPVPSASIIPLPTGGEKNIPRIQHKFKDESSLEQSDRLTKQARIKALFKKSWDGYTSHAWLHDELRPVSGSYRDPFCGWAATLVDSLDSLLIMGMQEEFERALEGLKEIDFTTTDRREIPVFETTIRYLGGLLAAYDLDGGKHKILLDKAVELAEILMGAFDTPNRMPQTFYQWMPIFAEQPKRARTRVVMAELGSMSVEFTRLAQITGEDKYYDAIARITNELDIWQNDTKIPGLWPLYVDASGCKKPNYLQDYAWRQKLIRPGNEDFEATTTIVAHPQGQAAAQTAAAIPKGESSSGDGETGSGLRERQLDNLAAGDPHDGFKNHADEDGFAPLDSTLSVPVRHGEGEVDCVPQGLGSPPGSDQEDFSFGGMADSTYEYLPKQHLLLGGQVGQYQKMYEKAIAAANKYLLFRPMTKTDEDILVIGNAKAQDPITKKGNLKVLPELSHLLCFAGGMYGLGSRIFDRPEDLEIGKKMTDACVWAYSATNTGIMPEDFSLLACDNLEHCKWNQTKWEYEIDPYPGTRISDGLMAMQPPRQASEPEPLPEPEVEAESLVDNKRRRSRRQADFESEPEPKAEVEIDDSIPPSRASSRTNYINNKASQDGTTNGRHGTPTTNNGGFAEHRQPMNQKEYVEYVTKVRGLPPGMPSISSRKYILRPEAIESVFYMYRLTGDKTWREKGWRMYEAIERATNSVYGASALLDVTAAYESISLLNEMESFWLAETLKYFYLLFSTEDTISLDEYVLNTEAHPFKRPTPGGR